MFMLDKVCMPCHSYCGKACSGEIDEQSGADVDKYLPGLGWAAPCAMPTHPAYDQLDLAWIAWVYFLMSGWATLEEHQATEHCKLVYHN